MTNAWAAVPRPVFIFDGDCGFCTSSAGVLRRFFDPRARYAIAPYQRLDLAAYGLTAADCDQAAQFVDEGGVVSSGHRSVAAALRHSLLMWRPIGVALTAPGVDALAARAYRWV
ncbi:MAG: DCC1-like thiol-disulfide oxidoreductase family protein, partial [Ornithinimicrobium sp.]